MLAEPRKLPRELPCKSGTEQTATNFYRLLRIATDKNKVTY